MHPHSPHPNDIPDSSYSFDSSLFFDPISPDGNGPRETEVAIVALHESLANGTMHALEISTLSDIPAENLCSSIQHPGVSLPAFPFLPRPPISPTASAAKGGGAARARSTAHGNSIVTQQPCGCVHTVATSAGGTISTVVAQHCPACAARAHRDERNRERGGSTITDALSPTAPHSPPAPLSPPAPPPVAPPGDGTHADRPEDGGAP